MNELDLAAPDLMYFLEGKEQTRIKKRQTICDITHMWMWLSKEQFLRSPAHLQPLEYLLLSFLLSLLEQALPIGSYRSVQFMSMEGTNVNNCMLQSVSNWIEPSSVISHVCVAYTSITHNHWHLKFWRLQFNFPQKQFDDII